MSQLLVLSEDELALLRFTGDLFFVDESPLIHVERAAREPADYAGSYKALVDRNIVDPHGFRITDDALNQLAPVTECDARIVHIIVDDDGTITQQDHWLLDEIAVVYERHGEGASAKHLFGPDLDPHQLVQRLGRQLVPRRSGGERFDTTLSAHDVVATTLLVEAAHRFDRRILTLDEIRTALGKMPADDGLVGALPALSSGRLGITKKPAREVRSVDAIVRSLTERGVVVVEGGGLRLHAALFALRGRRSARHTLVRTDFRDDDWLVREVTLLPVEGSLFLIAPGRGGFRIAELDGDALYAVLRDACGPASSSSPERPAPEPQRLAALLAGQPRRG
jgi:hypothetical protein